MSKGNKPHSIRRNFVKKHMDDFQKPKTHRDRSKDDPEDDSLEARLQDYLDELDYDDH